MCAWQSPRSAWRSASAPSASGLPAGRHEPTQVDRLLPAQALLDGSLGDLADARQLAQPAALGPTQDLSFPQLGERGRGAAEGAHPVARLLRRLEQERDPLEVGDRVPRSG